MNRITKLEIAFPSEDDVTSWAKPIRSRDSEAAGSVSFTKFLLGSGLNAAQRGELVVRHRLSRRLLSLPNHTLERPAP